MAPPEKPKKKIGYTVKEKNSQKPTRGKVFTLKTMDRLVECTRLKEFKAKT